MSDNVYIGRRCAAVSKPPALKPISKVVLWIDNNNCYEAGDSAGREIEITCPYGTQTMADDLLRKLSGYAYQPMTADDALLDPAAELGDAVTVDGCYTVMASMDLTFDGLLTGDIAAPGAAELAQEYQFSDNEKILSRKIARNRSAITKTAEEIRMEIFSLENGVNGRLEKYATLEITDSKIAGAVNSTKEYTDGQITEKLKDYATLEVTTQSIEAAVNSTKEYTDGKITEKLKDYATLDVTTTSIEAAVSSTKEYTDGQITEKLKDYATLELTTTSIEAAVSSTKEYTDGQITEKLKDYATLDVTTQSIEAAVNSTKEYTDGQITEKLKDYATLTIADDKISTAVTSAKTEINNGIDTTLKNYSTVDQTATKISAAVKGLVDGETLSSSITAALGELSLSASSANGKATLTLKDGNTQLSSKSFTLNVDAVNISGILSADSVDLDGMFKISRKDVFGSATGYIGTNTSKGSVMLASENLNTGFITNDTTAKMTYFDEHMIWVHSGGCYSNETIQIYSDRTLKDNINYDLSEEERLFSTLLPCSFSYISDKSAKKHWGFIAQDFIGSAEGLGMDTDKLAVIGEYEGKYSIGYGEITALNTHMIQKLMRRVAALESRLEE